jgi:hypothetical protein
MATGGATNAVLFLRGTLDPNMVMARAPPKRGKYSDEGFWWHEIDLYMRRPET